VGARSKPGNIRLFVKKDITRQPLWGRDQNSTYQIADALKKLPDSPCGGEIKTRLSPLHQHQQHYQTAPVGARSKPIGVWVHRLAGITRQPLWGRDQNKVVLQEVKE